MNPAFRFLAGALLALLPFLARAGDTLTLARARELASTAHPLQQKKPLAAAVADLQSRNLESNNLPRIVLGGQATWQTDVFGIKLPFPGVETAKIPKDQYRLTADVSERIWDGNSDRFYRQRYALDRDIALAQTDVDVYQVQEVVTDLFFRALLLQESEQTLLAARNDLQNKLKQAEGMIAEGVALRTYADQIRIRILQTDQQTDGLRADKKAVLATLADWTGQRVDQLAAPAPPTETNPDATVRRPEYNLFALQQQSLSLAADMLRLKTQPRVDAFAQGGFASPNPFNFFKTGFEPFALLGVRASWTPVDWGNRKRDTEVLSLQRSMIDTQRKAFDQRLTASTEKEQTDLIKAREALRLDDDIIRLQEDIIRRADAQVKNGVMTTTDYLAQLDILTQARLSRKTHEIQALQAVESLRAKRGQ